MDPRGIPDLIDQALAILNIARAELDVTFLRDGGVDVVEVKGAQFQLGPDDLGRVLGWERLVDALPTLVERARLESMHKAAAVNWAAPWSVYMTATSRAWLHHAAEELSSPARLAVFSQILDAADYDGDLTLASAVSATSSMRAFLRSRRLIARIQLGKDVVYDAVEGTMTATRELPPTAGVIAEGRNVADIIEAPWIREHGVTVVEARFQNASTILMLEEPLVPMMPLPVLGSSALFRQEPAHAPWSVTIEERQALDDLDVRAHGQG
jgi:hypothetical protein